jgi:lipopolysaccharide/colanic/teichoic acid biosynthesis glycosyltransferase
VVSLSETLTANNQKIEGGLFCFYEKAHPSVYSKTKRALDIVGSLVGLTVTGFIFVPIAVAMQLDSPGPVLYSQTRCGLNGREFRIWKFRSMRIGADREKHLVENQAQGLIFKNKNDPRVTKIGKFLRCSSLDEFPQFWNVLMGDMSLVGTRPPTPDEVSSYKEHHFQRLEVKPGLTGEWQVKGRSNVKNFEEVVALDLDYQKKWSVFYDIYLILRTISIVLARKGAY